MESIGDDERPGLLPAVPVGRPHIAHLAQGLGVLCHRSRDGADR
jgi:hypothetical protein